MGAGISSGIGGMAGKMFAPLAAGIAAVGIGSFFKDAIGGASDLGESASKVGVVFGKQFAPQILAASKTAAKGMGMSEAAYLAANGTLGNLLVSLKVAPKAAAGMSQEMVKLAGDMASFNNVPIEDALAAITSGLTGETEPLKRFGVNMNDATLKAQALKMGLIKSTKEAMDPQTKALAAQALIMGQTGTAQGDFARTSGGLANQQKILSAQFADVKTKVGGLLLPVVTKFVTLLNSGMGPALGKVTGFLQPLIEAVKVFFSFLNGNDTGVDGPFREMAVAGESARGVVATLVGFFQTQVVPALQQAATFIQTQVVPAFMSIVTAVQGFYAVALPIVAAFVTGMMARIGPMIPTIKAIFTQIGAIIVSVMGLIQAVISRVTTVISFVWAKWGGSIMSFISGVWTKVLSIIQAALGVISAVIRTMTAIFKGDWSGAWNGIRSIVTTAWTLIKAVISGALNVIGGAMSAAWALIKTGAAAAWDGVKGAIMGALAGAGTWLLDAGKKIISGLVDGIKSMASAPVDAVKGIVGKIADFLPGSPVKEGPLKVLNRGRAGSQIVSMLAGGIDSQRAAMEASMASLVSVPRPGSLDFATPAQRSAAVAGAGGSGGNGDLLAEVQGLRADIRALPKTYQMGQRQYVGAR